MAVVLLKKMWLHDAANLGDAILIQLGEEGEVKQRPVEARRYAGGRTRVVAQEGSGITLDFTLSRVPRSTYNALLSKVGVAMLLRDPRGRKLWGMYPSVSASEWRPREGTAVLDSVTFTFTQLTFNESV